MDAHLLYSHQSKPAAQPAPPPITITSLARITRESLADRLLSRQLGDDNDDDNSLAVIDVRDSDFVGGHIRGCTNVPSGSLDYALPQLVRELRDKRTVVFHCALSQQRGPGAALRYLRERARLGLDDAVGSAEAGEGGGEGLSAEAQGESAPDGDARPVKGQKVYVLDGGFVKWQEK
jgi:Cdc25 family phosphatase